MVESQGQAFTRYFRTFASAMKAHSNGKPVAKTSASKARPIVIPGIPESIRQDSSVIF